ncbi:hypothetical protein [Coleofasciculus sp. F4-SAH-05]
MITYQSETSVRSRICHSPTPKIFRLADGFSLRFKVDVSYI